MNDLISRQSVLNKLKDFSDMYTLNEEAKVVLEAIKEMITEQPTACDIEKVIKQIQEYAECKEECKNDFYYGQGCKACAWNGMIEIVKAGGIDG